MACGVGPRDASSVLDPMACDGPQSVASVFPCLCLWSLPASASLVFEFASLESKIFVDETVEDLQMCLGVRVFFGGVVCWFGLGFFSDACEFVGST